MDQQQKLPEFIDKHKTHTISKYSNLIYEKIIEKKTFEAEYLFKYLTDSQKDNCIILLNKKGLNLTKEQLLLINKK